jgi:AraC-like DNA-binding protein
MAVAIRQMHESPTWPWRIAQPAKQAALSRSAFFERFSRAVGVAPMEYLFAWRMALAKNLLRQEKVTSPKVAERVAYNAQSTFSIACTRYSDCRQRGMRGRDGIATPVRVHPSDIVARRVELVGLNDGSAFLLQLWDPLVLAAQLQKIATQSQTLMQRFVSSQPDALKLGIGDASSLGFDFFKLMTKMMTNPAAVAAV